MDKAVIKSIQIRIGDYWSGGGIQGSIMIGGSKEMQDLIEEKLRALLDEAERWINTHEADHSE